MSASQPPLPSLVSSLVSVANTGSTLRLLLHLLSELSSQVESPLPQLVAVLPSVSTKPQTSLFRTEAPAPNDPLPPENPMP